jgi:hypothetical protein
MLGEIEDERPDLPTEPTIPGGDDDDGDNDADAE